MTSVDELRARVHNPVVAAVVRPGDFDPTLHPRGRDGRFIRRFGFVKWLDKGKMRTGRVVGFKKSDSMWDKIDVSILDSETRKVVVKPQRFLEKTFRPKGHLMGPAGPPKVVTPEQGRASARRQRRVNIIGPEDRQAIIERQLRVVEPRKLLPGHSEYDKMKRDKYGMTLAASG